MEKKYKIILLFIMYCSFFVQGQITFQKVYSGLYTMDGLDAIPAIDGGYIIAGMTTNDIIEDTDIHIIKTNSTGDKLWEKSYGGAKVEYSFGILQATDNSGYYVVGYSQSYGGGDYDIWLLKVKVNGDTAWAKTYGSWGNDQGKEIIPTSDGNYMIVGWSNNTGGPNYEAWLIKIKPDGEVIWDKKYGGVNKDYGNSVKQTPDGGYIMLGNTFSFGSNGDAYLVKTDPLGAVEWSKNYGGANMDEGISVIANTDGTYTFCVRDSSTLNADVNVQVIKTDASGGIIWNKNYGGSQKDTDKMIQPTSDGGYVVAAITRSFPWNKMGLPDMWILKLNADGDTLWSRGYGGQDNEHCYSVRQTTDGGYIAVGKTESFSAEDGIMFLKLNPLGRLGPVGINEFASEGLTIYPNPSNGIVNIDLNDLKCSSVEVCNTLGQVVFSKIIQSSDQSKSIEIDLQQGIYFVTIVSTDRFISKKIIVN